MLRRIPRRGQAAALALAAILVTSGLFGLTTLRSSSARAVPPVAASAGVNRSNVGAPHSPQLLRELAGPLARTGQHPAAAGAAPAAASATVQGVDVASYQHPNGAAITWTQVVSAGYEFAAIKATEGNYYINPYYASDLADAKAAGLFVAAYHVAIPNVTAGAAQADYAVSHTGYTADGRTLPLELDAEYDPYASSDHTNMCYRLTPAQMVSWIAAFASETQRLTGQLPIIYTIADWWDTCTGDSAAFGSDPLWVAAYAAASPPLPAGWTNWTLWQYTSGGTVPGISTAGATDISYVNTSVVTLLDPGDQQEAAGSPVSLQVNSLDPAPAQPLTYTATGLPPGASISDSGQITGTPATAGAYDVTVTATDPSGATGSAAFTWYVHGTVTVTVPGDQGTTAGSPVSLQAQAADSVAGYAPSFTASGLPPGLSISGAGQITGWAAAAGTFGVTVTAADALHGWGSASFTWTVSQAPGSGPSGPVALDLAAKCLDDTGNGTANGTKIEIWTCDGGGAQHWTVVQDAAMRIHGKCLDIVSGATANGGRIDLWPCTGGLNQQWQAGVAGELLNPHSGKCLDDPGASTKNGIQLDIWTCNGRVSQKWTRPAGPVASGFPGKCADDPGFRTASGTRLDIWTCNGGKNQAWTAQPDGTIRLAGKCLDVFGSGTAAGSPVDLYACNRSGAQLWRLVPAGPIGSELVNPESGRCLADPGDAAANGTGLVIQNCPSAPGPATTWHVI